MWLQAEGGRAGAGGGRRMATAAQRKRVESAANADEAGRHRAECKGWVLRGWMLGWIWCLIAISNRIFLSSVREERRGSSVNVTQVAKGDASLTLAQLKARDEGSYICSVSLGPFHAQQIIRLRLFRRYSFSWKCFIVLSLICCCRTAPGVTVTGEVGFSGKASDPELPLLWILSSGCSGLWESLEGVTCPWSVIWPFSPLQMEWSLLYPTDKEPTVSTDQGSLSSHRQHGDGSYSLSSHLTVPSTATPGTKISCKVSHQALSAPTSVTLLVESPQTSMSLTVSALKAQCWNKWILLLSFL